MKIMTIISFLHADPFEELRNYVATDKQKFYVEKTHSNPFCTSDDENSVEIVCYTILILAVLVVYCLNSQLN